MRVGQWLDAWGKHDPDEPHVHLGPLGVDAHLQGQGVGSLILAEHCRRLDAAGILGYLETDKPDNVRLYERFGYVVTAEAPVIGVPNSVHAARAGGPEHGGGGLEPPPLRTVEGRNSHARPGVAPAHPLAARLGPPAAQEGRPRRRRAVAARGLEARVVSARARDGRRGRIAAPAPPTGPRCGVCGAPFPGFGGRLAGPLGYRPSRKNPEVCSVCVEFSPPGGMTLYTGVLFADLRSFTARFEGKDPQEAAASCAASTAAPRTSSSPRP